MVLVLALILLTVSAMRTTGNINVGLRIRFSIVVNIHIGIVISIRLDMRIHIGFRSSPHILLLLIYQH